MEGSPFSPARFPSGYRDSHVGSVGKKRVGGSSQLPAENKQNLKSERKLQLQFSFAFQGFLFVCLLVWFGFLLVLFCLWGVFLPRFSPAAAGQPPGPGWGGGGGGSLGNEPVSAAAAPAHSTGDTAGAAATSPYPQRKSRPVPAAGDIYIF